MSHVEFIVFEESLNLEGEFVVHSPGPFSGDLTLLVADIFAGPPPATVQAKNIFVFCHGVDGGTHAVVEERVSFGEVDYIEGVLLVDQHAFY